MIEGYKLGTATLKSFLALNKLNVEDVHQTMDEMNDLLADQKELEDAMKNITVLVDEEDEADMERELQMLIEADHLEKTKLLSRNSSKQLDSGIEHQLEKLTIANTPLLPLVVDQDKKGKKTKMQDPTPC